mmetsp:Transcript_2391/g.4911  ORF Transcript_2391/g.4911 Transcript_2391/m.4911 type:complete len:276 (-) Transcript_2391:62-889(-)
MRYVAFDRGKRAWSPKGLPSVGCATVEVAHEFYNHSYSGAVYYSLPGRCSLHEYTEKTPDKCCEAWEALPWSAHNEARARAAQPFPYVPDPDFIWANHMPVNQHGDRKRAMDTAATTEQNLSKEHPHRALGSPPPPVRVCTKMDIGGECESSQDVGKGQCTWHAEPAGQVSLDELCGIPPGQHDKFCSAGGRDWVSDGDKPWASVCTRSKEAPGEGQGRGMLPQRGGGNSHSPMCFWNGRTDPFRNAQRVKALKELFERKYPSLPHDLGSPACGW